MEKQEENGAEKNAPATTDSTSEAARVTEPNARVTDESHVANDGSDGSTSPAEPPNPGATDEPVRTLPPKPVTIAGPVSHANWVGADLGGRSDGATEVLLYSDARFVGEVREGAGPYRLLNMIHVAEGRLLPALALQIDWFVQSVFDSSANKTDVSGYTGATVADEIAVLMSLATGARLAAGAETRRFENDDPRGKPINDWYPPPALNIPTFVRAPTIPNATEAKTVDAELLQTYRKLDAADAVVLVRAARAYRDALWVSDSHPELSWLLMVSALEAAAVQETQNEEPEVQLRQVAPKVAAALDAISDTAAEQAAPHIAHLFKATSRFLKFMDKFTPEEPSNRPAMGRIKWSRRGLQDALNAVYAARSDALHSAIPIPAPMCLPPDHLGSGYAEKSIGLATHMNNVDER